MSTIRLLILTGIAMGCLAVWLSPVASSPAASVGVNQPSRLQRLNPDEFWKYHRGLQCGVAAPVQAHRAEQMPRIDTASAADSFAPAGASVISFSVAPRRISGEAPGFGEAASWKPGKDERLTAIAAHPIEGRAPPTGLTGTGQSDQAGLDRLIPLAADPTPTPTVNSIQSFVDCLNRQLPGGPADVSKTVACLPPGCYITLTMSTASAQAACSLGGCQLPRVILDCPGTACNLRFRPSYLLCPADSASDGMVGVNRVEVGEDLTPLTFPEPPRSANPPTGSMLMGDIPVPPTAKQTPIAGVISTQDDNKGCNLCHLSVKEPTPTPTAVLSQPIDPFGLSGENLGNNELAGFIIYTNEPGKTVKPTEKGTDGKPLVAQNLGQICTCIKNNQTNITKAIAALPTPTPLADTRAMLALCNALNGYATGPAASPIPTCSPTPGKPTRTPSRTPSPSPSRSTTPSPTPTRTAIRATPTPLVMPTSTRSGTPTPTGTRTNTPTPTRTSTAIPSLTRTVTPTLTASHTPSRTPTATPTHTASATPSRTASGTPIATISPTHTPSRTATATPTRTASGTPSATISPTHIPSGTATANAARTASGTPSATTSPTYTPSRTATATATPTRTPSGTPSSTPTYTPTGTPTATSTLTPTATGTPTGSATPTPTRSGTPTGTATLIPTPSRAPTGTVTLTPAQSPTLMPTPIDTPTPRATSIQTPIPTPIATPLPTPTQTPSATPTPQNIGTNNCPDVARAYRTRSTGNVMLLSRVAGPASPGGIAVDSSGNTYLTNFCANTVTVYASGSDGAAAPLATIGGSNTGLNKPEGIALDSNGNIYVTNVGLKQSSVTVYAAGSSGNVAPIATIRGSDTNLNFPLGVAVDSDGKIYVTNKNSQSVTIYPAGSNGNVMPGAEIAGSNTGLDDPFGIAADSSANIYVANNASGSSGSVTVYAEGSNGDVMPSATISGAGTGLGGAEGLALDASANIYVANSVNGSITVYAAGSDGDAAPTATISGFSTGLNGPRGVALDSSGNIHVANNFNGTGGGSVTVYRTGSNGNIAPAATISGSDPQLN